MSGSPWTQTGQKPNLGRQAVAVVLATNPDVVLVDLVMPEMDGVGAKRIIHKERPHCRVINLSSIEQEVRTVKSHGCSILDKFGLQSRNLRLGLSRTERFL